MVATTQLTQSRLRTRLAALLVVAFLASVMLIVSPAPQAQAHTSGGCSAVASHIHGAWSYRARATHLSGSGQTLITWERRYASQPDTWKYWNSHIC